MCDNCFIVMEDMNKNLLTNREKEVLQLIAKGFTNPEIAEILFISIHTVKAHLESLYYKFSVHNKVQVVVRALKEDWVDLNDITE